MIGHVVVCLAVLTTGLLLTLRANAQAVRIPPLAPDGT